MRDATAMRVAIDLLRIPSRVRMLRQAALPEGMDLLLHVAAGERTAVAEAIELTERTEAVLREAAEFFIEQILLAPEADSYRVLGAGRDATVADLRRNMALLLSWMHPDVALTVDRSMFAGRVTVAWDDLKTAERRAAYDHSLPALTSDPSPTRSKRGSASPHRKRRLRGAATDARDDRKHMRFVDARSREASKPLSFWRRAWSYFGRRTTD